MGWVTKVPTANEHTKNRSIHDETRFEIFLKISPRAGLGKA